VERRQDRAGLPHLRHLHRRPRYTSLATAPGSVLDALCDNLRSIDDLTATHAAADLFRVI
jgi:hypothetical protein